MGAKYNVEVFLPIIQKKYDYLIPAGITVGAAAILISRTIKEHEHIDIDEENLLLCKVDGKEILDDSKFVSEAGITDGCNLVLV